MYRIEMVIYSEFFKQNQKSMLEIMLDVAKHIFIPINVSMHYSLKFIGVIYSSVGIFHIDML